MTITSTLNYANEREKQLIRLAKLLAPAANDYMRSRPEFLTPDGRLTGLSKASDMFDAIVHAASKVSRADAQKYHAWLTKANYTSWIAGTGIVEPEERPDAKREIVSKVVNGVEVSPMWVVISIAFAADSVPGETLRARVVEALSRVIGEGK